MAKEQYFAHPPRGHVAILAYDDVNNRWQVLECTEDGYLKTRLQEVNGTVLIQQYMPSLLQPGINTYDGSAWRKQAPIWGYTDSLWGQASGTAAAAATYFVVGGLVPAGEVWVVNRVSWYRSVNVPTIVRLSVYTAGAYVNMIDYNATIVSVYFADDLRAVLKAGERLRFGFAGATIGEYCEAHWWGYKMSVTM